MSEHGALAIDSQKVDAVPSASAAQSISTNSNEVQLTALFSELREEVFARRPILRRLLEQQGTQSLYAYAQTYAKTSVGSNAEARQAEFLKVFESMVARLLGPEVATKTTEQLRAKYYASTADHHGPICHPFFVNSNLVAAAPYIDQEETTSSIVVLANSNVSLNNSSYPRGLLFTSRTNATAKTVYLPFFPASERLCPVFNFRPYNERDIKKISQIIRTGVGDGSIEHDVAEKITTLIDELLLSPELLDSASYSDQITKLNFKLWKKFFHHHSAPDLVYLELETLVLRLLEEHHLDQSTFVHKLLFDPTTRSMALKRFDGMLSAFSSTDKSGTFMFWALAPGQKYRQRLWIEGEELITDDGTYRVALTPAAIRSAMDRHELIPSSLLSYAVVSLYYGLKCLGGFSQINYLTFMKEGFVEIARAIGDEATAAIAEAVVTDSMCGDFTVAVMTAEDGTRVPMTGLDLIIYGDDETWHKLADNIQSLSIQDSLNPMMPELYKIIYPLAERRPDFNMISSADVATIVSGGRVLESCVVL